MLDSTIIRFLICLTNLLLTHAYVPLLVTIKDSRIKVVPNLQHSSSFAYNDDAYVYGGYYTYATEKSMSNTMYQFKFVEKSANLELSIVNTTNSGPRCYDCAIYPIQNTTRVYVIGIQEPSETDNGTLPLFHPYLFDFSSLTWTNLTDTAIYNGGVRGTRAFAHRLVYSSVLVKNSLIYIMGGSIPRGDARTRTVLCARSVIYYDTTTNTFNVLEKDAPECRIGANSFITERSDEEIFTLFGDADIDISYNFTEQNNAYGTTKYFTGAPPASPNTFVLNITSGDWSYIKPVQKPDNLQARYMSTIQYDSSTSQVVVFGNEVKSNHEADYSTGNQTFPDSIYYYNTISSTWTAAPNTGITKGRSGGSSVLLKDRYFILFYGHNYKASTIHEQRTDIFDLQTQQFLVKEVPDGRPDLSKALQYGLVVITIIGVVILFATTVIVAQKLHLIDNARAVLTQTMYEPRNGEPIWTESLRSLAKLFCFIVFVLFIVYSYDNVVNSPISTTSDFKTAETLRYPDVRFCISNRDDSDEYLNKDQFTNTLSCTVGREPMESEIRRCSSEIRKIHDLSRHTPFLDSYLASHIVCYMLVSNDNFTATSDSPSISIHVPDFYNLTNPIIDVNVYDPEHNPNRYVFLDKPLPTGWTMEDIEYWNVEGDTFLQRPDTYSSSGFDNSLIISFGKKTYKTLNSKAAGNYIGGSLFSAYDYASNYTLAFDRLSTNSTGLVIKLNVASFNVETITQRRSNTLLGALATAGGILGLLTTILALLFGSRPKSPWGFIHFTARKTLRQNLSRAFDNGENDTLIPLVEPVGERLAELNIQNSNEQVGHLTQHCDNMTRHMSRMESRIQMLETVLHSYYIDDKIFQSLKENRDKSSSANHSNTNLTDSPTKETLTNDKYSDKDCITESLLVESPNEDREQ